MQLEKSGYYDISDICGEISVASGIEVILFDSGSKESAIKLAKNAKLHFFGYYEKQRVEKSILNEGEKSSAEIRICNFSLHSSLSLNASFEVRADNTKSHAQILSFAGSGGHLSIEAQSRVKENIKHASVSLLEKNVFLDEEASIRCVPGLFVASDDVEAHHACQIERINKEHLFYLQSRGVAHRRALCLLLEASFKNVFSSLKDFDEEKYQEVFKKVMKHIQ